MHHTKQIKTKKDIIVALSGALAVLILLDLTPLGGNTLFYLKWVACGDRPIYTQKGSGIASPGVPNYVNAPVFGIGRGFMPYFCNPRDAELAGYSANPRTYDFPHLNSSEQEKAMSNARRISE